MTSNCVNNDIYVTIYRIKPLVKSLNCSSELAHIKPLLSNVRFDMDKKGNIIKNSIKVFSDFHPSTLYFYDYLNFANVYGAEIIVSAKDSIHINELLRNHDCYMIITNNDKQEYNANFIKSIDKIMSTPKKQQFNYGKIIITGGTILIMSSMLFLGFLVGGMNRNDIK